MHIVGLPGSLRVGSVNRRLLDAAAHLLPEDVTIEVFEGIGQLPLFNEDLETDPPQVAVAALNEAISDADAVLVATPEYNGSVPGPLKNALDWASRPHRAAPLVDKPVAVVGASPSPYGAVRAQADARKILNSIGAQVVEQEVAVGRAFDAFQADGRLREPDLEAQLRELVAELVDSADSHQTELVAATA